MWDPASHGLIIKLQDYNTKDTKDYLIYHNLQIYKMTCNKKPYVPVASVYLQIEFSKLTSAKK